MLNIILLPLDLVYLTLDLWRIWLNSSAHGGTVCTNHLQACVFCHAVDAGTFPRKAPPGVRKYRNRWLIHSVQPCLKVHQWNGGPHSVCQQDHMFVRYSRFIPVATLLLTGLWVGGIAAILLLATR